MLTGLASLGAVIFQQTAILFFRANTQIDQWLTPKVTVGDGGHPPRSVLCRGRNIDWKSEGKQPLSRTCSKHHDHVCGRIDAFRTLSGQGVGYVAAHNPGIE